MLFCSWTFARFFAVVFTVYWLLPRRRLALALPGTRRTLTVDSGELRVWWLLAASVYFYASWSKMLALLICATTMTDYFIGLGLEAVAAPRWRRALLGLSLAGNLGVLCYFKYANFF